jgi:hypothetical protein
MALDKISDSESTRADCPMTDDTMKIEDTVPDAEGRNGPWD